MGAFREAPPCEVVSPACWRPSARPPLLWAYAST